MRKEKQEKVWELKQLASDPATLNMYIYGNVEGGGYDFWTDEEIVSETSADFFKSELAKYPDAKNINVYVNSYGGSCFEMMSIRNQLKRSSATVTGIVDGFAASAASFILTGCDVVKMYSNTTQMLHNMLNCVMGNSAQFRKAADDMDIMMVGNRKAYLEKSNGKLTEEKLIEIMAGETWLTAEQCLEIGLCDEVIAEEVNLDAAKQLVQRMNVSMQQQIDSNKKIAMQLKEMVTIIPKIEKPIQKTNFERMMESYKNKNLEVK